MELQLYFSTIIELATALLFRDSGCNDVPFLVVSSPNEQSCSFTTCEASQEQYGMIYKTVLCRLNIEEVLKTYALGSSFAFVTHYPNGGCLNPPVLYEAIQVPTCTGNIMWQPCNGSASVECWKIGEVSIINRDTNDVILISSAASSIRPEHRSTDETWTSHDCYYRIWMDSSGSILGPLGTLNEPVPRSTGFGSLEICFQY